LAVGPGAALIVRFRAFVYGKGPNLTMLGQSVGGRRAGRPECV